MVAPNKIFVLSRKESSVHKIEKAARSGKKCGENEKSEQHRTARRAKREKETERGRQKCLPKQFASKNFLQMRLTCIQPFAG